ncbi:MAG: DUF3089 domain-containing protein [Microthrixaceae bacterium]|nr:DUF3089 domain-containing protein [Microthrixaceae bacterium]
MRPLTRAVLATGFCTLLVVPACSPDDAGDASGSETNDPTSESTATEPTVSGETSETYADPVNWLCRPDVDNDACDVDLDATLVHPDGSTEPEPFVAATDAPVDCFYVYPTISTDEGENSDLVPGESEKGVAAGQAARFAEVCNVYAPMYRQIPLGALMDRLSGAADETTTTANPDTGGSGNEGADGPVGGAPGRSPTATCARRSCTTWPRTTTAGRSS